MMDALVFRNETGVSRRLSFAQLYRQVAHSVPPCASKAWLQATGCRLHAQSAETVVAMLACASIGAVWSSCSPDFGIQGVLDRFGQIEPKVLFCADGLSVCRQTHRQPGSRCADCRATAQPAAGLSSSRTRPAQHWRTATAISWEQALGNDASEIVFARWHLITRCTSCIRPAPPACPNASSTRRVALLQHLKEHLLHGDLRAGDRIFYFTTCGWMMWNWLVSAHWQSGQR